MLRFSRRFFKNSLPKNIKPAGLKGNGCVALRREDKNRWERRAPLTPSHVKVLTRNGINVIVQPSTLRIFTDSDYESAGAVVTEDISASSVILGVKEVPVHKLIPDRTYVFFSHTIKAQASNMPLLDAILDQNIRLIDYERIVDSDNNRLVRFGRYAGYAGQIDFLHGLGNRLLALGYSTPFLHIGYTHMYSELDMARAALKGMGKAIAQQGLPRDLGPLIFTFTGTGAVSRGAQEMLSLLPVKFVTKEDLPSLAASTNDFDNHTLYAYVASSADLVRPRGKSTKKKTFDRHDYYANPHLYESTFAQDVAPYTSVLVNCMYWDQRYPRLLTVQQTEDLARAKRLRLLGLADLSADPGGAVEWMSHCTSIDYPFYVYDPVTHEQHESMGEQSGVLVFSVDNLPTEIPIEASQYFGDSLLPWVENLAQSDGTLPVADQKDLSNALRAATVTSHGALTPSYEYISEFRRQNEENAALKHGTAGGVRHRVLVLGAGMVAQPVVQHLLQYPTIHVTVASEDIEQAQRMVLDRPRTEAVQLQLGSSASPSSELYQLIRSHDIVVSLLPAPLHPVVAEQCLAASRSMVTSSYASPEMRKLDEKARAAGLTFLSEVGLDPGIDHLLSMRVINEALGRGGRLTSFVSFCGGLPAPEDSDNPLAYRFSWSPRGVLVAAKAGAQYRQDDKLVEVAPGTLYEHAVPVPLFPGFSLEAVPNRDSLAYAEQYGVPDAPTFIRATLRYPGFAELVAAFTRVGLLDESPCPVFAPGAPSLSWRGAMQALLPGDSSHLDVEGAFLRQAGLAEPGQEERAARVARSLNWLGLFSADEPAPQTGSRLDALTDLLQKKLGYEPGQRDLVVMRHYFRFQFKDHEESHISSMVVYGDESHSAMSKTVGTPTAIATKLILDDYIVRRGVITPLTPDIYTPMLSELKKSGIEAKEEKCDWQEIPLLSTA